jgi:hypothetical protein
LRPLPGCIGFYRLMFVLTAMAFITSAVPSGGADGVVLRARMLGNFGCSVEVRLETFHAGLQELSNAPRWQFPAATAGRILLDVATVGVCFGG